MVDNSFHIVSEDTLEHAWGLEWIGLGLFLPRESTIAILKADDPPIFHPR